MYEDFNYITDNNFLVNYWWHEKVICQKCHGKGQVTATDKQNTISCSVCQGIGKIQRHQQLDTPAA